MGLRGRDRPPGLDRVRPDPRCQRPGMAGRRAGQAAGRPACPRQPDSAESDARLAVDGVTAGRHARVRGKVGRQRDPGDGPRYPWYPDRRGVRTARGHGSGRRLARPWSAGRLSSEIGAETMIGAQVTLCAGMLPGQDLGDSPLLRIGDRCVIGRGSHIVAHQSIMIGADVFTGPYVYITDQNHGYADPEVPIGRQWPINAAVSIGPGCWLGAGAVVLPGASIGANVVVAAGAVVRGKVPSHCVVAGVPARVVREYTAGSGWSRPSSGPD